MDRFEYVCNLGEGAYGMVWLCTDKETNQKVAMKRFKDAHTDPEVMRLALREVRLLKASQHPNVVKMLEAFRSKSGRVYIAMEYVERTLTQDLRKYHGKGFPPLLAKTIAFQLLQAVKHLHNNKVMHRDLKPANILLTNDYDVKVCDFGFARTLHPREVAEYTTYVVTRWYRAPEILVSDSYGPKVDVWAVGCLLAEMVGGRPLFPGKSSADQMWLTMRTLGNLPPGQAALLALDNLYKGATWPTAAERTTLARRFPQFPPELLDLLHGCLALDPGQRYNTDEALAHPYFSDVPQVQEAIEATGQPASVFWGKVEEAWLSAVAANGNNVSSMNFQKTSKSHSQLAALLQSDVDIQVPSGNQSLATTPMAPRDFARRGLSTCSSMQGLDMTCTKEMDTMTTGDFNNVLLSTQGMWPTSACSNVGPKSELTQGPRSHGATDGGAQTLPAQVHSRPVSRAQSQSGTSMLERTQAASSSLPSDFGYEGTPRAQTNAPRRVPSTVRDRTSLRVAIATQQAGKADPSTPLMKQKSRLASSHSGIADPALDAAIRAAVTASPHGILKGPPVDLTTGSSSMTPRTGKSLTFDSTITGADSLRQPRFSSAFQEAGGGLSSNTSPKTVGSTSQAGSERGSAQGSLISGEPSRMSGHIASVRNAAPSPAQEFSSLPAAPQPPSVPKPSLLPSQPGSLSVSWSNSRSAHTPELDHANDPGFLSKLKTKFASLIGPSPTAPASKASSPVTAQALATSKEREILPALKIGSNPLDTM